MAFAKTVKTKTVIHVRDLKSKPYIDLTLKVLEDFGFNVSHQAYKEFTIYPVEPSVNTIQYTVEGDWSGAAFLLVAGAIAGEITIKGLELDSTQADKAILKALATAGVNLQLEQDQIIVSATELKSFEFDATDCPDLFPPLVALAAHCKGISTIKGVSRLSHKESNRGLSLQESFAKLDVNIQLKGTKCTLKALKKYKGIRYIHFMITE
jgi:3-phosphoshikimate 1-carboxyvinyltransferase